MKTFTVATAHASKKGTMNTPIVFSLSSSRWKFRHFLLSTINWGSILSWFFAMPQANKTKEIIGLRPMSFFKLVQCPRVWFFWGWYLKDSDVIHCSPPYSMKTFTVAAAHASKRVTMITAIIYSLPSSRWKVRHFLLSRINKDARAKMRVSWIRSTISLQQMSKSNILNSCHYGCRLNYSYSSLSTFWTSNLSLAMLIIGDC